MKITKYVHSCLLVETPKQTVLIDPGTYSWHSHLLPVSILDKLDYIVITHEHPDHFSLPFLKELSAKFPHAEIITNENLAKRIKSAKLPNPVVTGTQPDIEVFPAAHETPSWEFAAPVNIGVHIENFLTHPGDALNIKSTRDILALPITAPFASIKESLEAIVKLKPSKVIPLHDWAWHKDARAEYYANTKEYLAKKGIGFIELENGVPLEL